MGEGIVLFIFDEVHKFSSSSRMAEKRLGKYALRIGLFTTTEVQRVQAISNLP